VRLPENLRSQLKVPFGTLIPDENITKEIILKQISDDSYVITVGDATTEKMLKLGIVPSLQIIDAREKRVKRGAPETKENTVNLSCTNPAGEITVQSIDTIKQALNEKPPVRITVNGEEDLLVIPVCIHGPDNATIMYGQPNEGLVIVRLTEDLRKKTKSILDSMV
jgi:uncharacterized protein (UPF0218 family)